MKTVIFILLMLPGALCRAQFFQPALNEEKLNEDWRWLTFSLESGLPSNHVTSLLEASNGIVWVATSAGIAWYDGFRWNPVDSSHGLPQGGIRSMSIGSNDSLVVVAENGFMYRGGIGGFHRLDVPWSSGEAVAYGKNVVIHYRGQLLLYGGNDIEIFGPLPPGFRGFSDNQNLWVTKGGSLWFNSQGGLFRWDGKSWKLKIKSQERDCIINCLIEDRKGNGLVSIGMPFGLRGVWEWTQNSVAKLNPTIRGDWIKTMDISEQGEVVAVEKSNDIFLKRQTSWSRLLNIPLPMRDVEFVSFRKNGDFWVGTRKGLFLYRQYSLLWEYYSNGFPNRNRVHEIIRAVDGSIWLGTADGLEILRSNRDREIITHILGNPLYEITGIAEDSEGYIWVSSGSGFDGAYRWDGVEWAYFRIDSDVDWLKIHKIRKDRRGRLWFLGLSKKAGGPEEDEPGAYVYENGLFTRWSKKDGLLSGRVYAFAEKNDGSLWFGTHTALSRWKKGKWTHWRIREELPFSRIFTIAVDNSDKVWFSDQRSGLGCIGTDDNLEIFTKREGLVDDRVWDLAVDSKGRLWITTEGGLSSYDRGRWKTYGIKSGLLTTDLWPVLPAGDTVYVGTRGKGLAILNLRRSHQPAPRIYFDTPVVEGNKAVIRVSPYAFWGELSPREINIRHSVNSGNWTGWSTAHDIVLTDLPSGDYSIRIQAQNPYGEFDPMGAIGYFSIAPPLHLLPVFFLPVGGLFLLITFLGIEYLVRMRRYNRNIRENEAKFRRLAESTFEGIVIHDEGLIREVNQNIMKIFGYTYQELRRKSLLDLVAPEDREKVRPGISQLAEKPFEIIGVRKDGSKIWCEMRLSSTTSDGVTSSVAAVRDITERKESEAKLLNYQEQLRSLASELSITEERERRRMASFLHDAIGQSLAFCKIKLSTLQVANPEEKLSKPLKEIRDLVNKAIQDTRSLTFNLSPPILYELGLEAAVESLIDQMREQHGIQFKFFDDKNAKPLSSEFRGIFYAAVRELLTNVVKHAQAKSVDISVCRWRDNIRVIVADDGRGFSTAKIAKFGKKQNGFGLFNIREKVRHLGGYMEIESAPGKGTRVSVIAPLLNNQTHISDDNHERTDSSRR